MKPGDCSQYVSHKAEGLGGVRRRQEKKRLKAEPLRRRRGGVGYDEAEFCGPNWGVSVSTVGAHQRIILDDVLSGLQNVTWRQIDLMIIGGGVQPWLMSRFQPHSSALRRD
jgi:hypothetical protein